MADEPTDTADLDALLGESVSTTASKEAQASTAVPALAINITAEDLRRHGIRTLGEAYNFLALGLIAEAPLGNVEVGSRGVLFTNDNGKHVLLLLDGHVTNDQRNGASYHSETAGIPIEMIDHIEVMLGPGSVLYGANATLGVVNVVTKRARDYGGLQLIAESAFSPPQNQARQPAGAAAERPVPEADRARLSRRPRASAELSDSRVAPPRSPARSSTTTSPDRRSAGRRSSPATSATARTPPSGSGAAARRAATTSASRPATCACRWATSSSRCTGSSREPRRHIRAFRASSATSTTRSPTAIAATARSTSAGPGRSRAAPRSRRGSTATLPTRIRRSGARAFSGVSADRTMAASAGATAKVSGRAPSCKPRSSGWLTSRCRRCWDSRGACAGSHSTAASPTSAAERPSPASGTTGRSAPAARSTRSRFITRCPPSR